MEDLDLSARLNAFERRYARALFVQALFAAVAGLAIVWLAVRTPKTVAAERYVLRDTSGQVRGEWAPTREITGEENGKPMEASTTCLVMRSMGRSRASLCVPWEEPGDSARLSLGHGTGSKASLIAGAFNGQVILTSRASAEDKNPRSLAVLIASHVESGMTLRYDKKASRWTSAGAVTPSPPPSGTPPTAEP